MKILYPGIFIFCISVSGYSQNILAGEHGPLDFFDALTDDPVVSVDEISMAFEYDTLHLDLNGDLALDFNLITYNENLGNWGQDKHCFIQSIGSNRVAIEGYQSAYVLCPPPDEFNSRPFALSLDSGAVINSEMDWLSGKVYLAVSDWSANQPNACGSGFNYTSFEGVGGYVALEVITAADTMCGWLKVSDVSSYTVTCEEFACNTYTVGIEEKEPLLRIFPNPSNGIFQISTSDRSLRNSFVLIYDMNGELVSQARITGEDQNIDVSDLCSGIYMLAIDGKKSVKLIQRISIN